MNLGLKPLHLELKLVLHRPIECTPFNQSWQGLGPSVGPHFAKEASAIFFLHICTHVSTAKALETSFQTFIKRLLCRQIEPKAQETSGAIKRDCSGRKASAVSNRLGRRA